MTTIGAIGPLPSPPEEYDPVYMQQLVDTLEQIHNLLSRQIGTGWQVTNVTTDTVLAELADVVGTLVTQMKNRGLLGG